MGLFLPRQRSLEKRCWNDSQSRSVSSKKSSRLIFGVSGCINRACWSRTTPSPGCCRRQGDSLSQGGHVGGAHVERLFVRITDIECCVKCVPAVYVGSVRGQSLRPTREPRVPGPPAGREGVNVGGWRVERSRMRELQSICSLYPVLRRAEASKEKVRTERVRRRFLHRDFAIPGIAKPRWRKRSPSVPSEPRIRSTPLISEPSVPSEPMNRISVSE